MNILPVIEQFWSRTGTVLSPQTSGDTLSLAGLTLTTTPLAVGSGGTGLATLATGYIPYGNGTGALSSSANLTFDGNILSVLSNTTGGLYLLQAGTDTNGYDLNIKKARGTIASPAALAVNDELGNLNFQGWTATYGYRTGASIKSFIGDSAPADRVPTHLAFYTSPNVTGASYTLLERMRISRDGRVGIGTILPEFGLDIVSGTGLRLRTVETNNADKYAYITCGSKDNTEESLLLLFAGSEPSNSYIRYGGGSGAYNAATIIQFYTAASINTLTGTERLRIDATGLATFYGAATITGLTTANSGIATPKGAITLGVGATAIAITKGFHVITGDAGGNTVATITGGVDGQILRLLFVDALVTITDTDAHTANTVDLSAAFTSADDTVLTLISDGTSWYEISRSVN